MISSRKTRPSSAIFSSAMRKIAAQLDLADGYRVVTNCGRDAGQEVPHLHFHLIAGRKFTWPPG